MTGRKTRDPDEFWTKAREEPEDKLANPFFDISEDYIKDYKKP